MELRVISSRDQLAQYRGDWSTILEKKRNTNPFIEFDWVNKWWKYLGEDHCVEVIVVLENGQIIGFFPFLYEKNAFAYTYRFVGFGQANYMDVVADDSQLDELIEFVLNEIIVARKHVVFYLHGLLESGNTPTSLERYLQKQNQPFSIHRVITPYINLNKIKLEKYMEKRRRLHRLDRREKRLRESGKVELLRSGPEQMDVIFQLHDKRWKKKRDTSGFTNEKEKAFYKSLAHMESGPLTTEIDGIYINDTMIAFNYGFNCRGKFLGYVLGYDDDFETFGPGRILEKEKILQCKNGNNDLFDLSIGYEKYKFDWNTDLDYTRRMIFSSPTKRAKMVRAFYSTKEFLVEQVKKNQKFVLFKRNTVGKYLFLLKNLFSKEVREEMQNFFHRIWQSIYEKERYIVYKMEKKDIPDIPIDHHFVELTLNDAMKNEEIAKTYMKEICKKMYGGYKGYYPVDHLSFDTIFWTNEKVLRIDRISYLEQFKKSSIYFKNWNEENLPEVCSAIKKNSKARMVYVTVEDRSQDKKCALENIGFSAFKEIDKRTYFGFGKYEITE